MNRALGSPSFVHNPEYFIAVQGEPAGPNAAYETIQAKPPPGWSFAKKWLIGYFDTAGSMIFTVPAKPESS
jgi:hypothetical protein